MSKIQIPRIPPTAKQLEMPRAMFCQLVHALASEVLRRTKDLYKANDAQELAAAIRAMAEKLSEASDGWEGLDDVAKGWWRK